MYELRSGKRGVMNGRRNHGPLRTGMSEARLNSGGGGAGGAVWLTERG